MIIAGYCRALAEIFNNFLAFPAEKGLHFPMCIPCVVLKDLAAAMQSFEKDLVSGQSSILLYFADR